MLAKVPNRDTRTVVNALIRQARKLPDELYKSLTWDRGKKLADHKRFTWKPTSTSTSATRKARGSADQTKIPIGFCDSTLPEGPTSLPTRKPHSIRWPASSTSGLEKHWTSTRQQRDSTTVLRRPVETTTIAEIPLYSGWNHKASVNGMTEQHASAIIPKKEN